MTTHCRIGKVKMKEGGATIHPLHPKTRTDKHRELLKHASMICDWYPQEEMVGFVIIGWDKESGHSIGYYLGDETPVRSALVPLWISDILRRKFIQDGTWNDD